MGDDAAADELAGRLPAIEQAIEANDYRTANIGAGYIYVISNIGALGPNIVKIGMTRRLDPRDRVRELGDASVPFLTTPMPSSSPTTPSPWRTSCTRSSRTGG